MLKSLGCDIVSSFIRSSVRPTFTKYPLWPDTGHWVNKMTFLPSSLHVGGRIMLQAGILQIFWARTRCFVPICFTFVKQKIRLFDVSAMLNKSFQVSVLRFFTRHGNGSNQFFQDTVVHGSRSEYLCSSTLPDLSGVCGPAAPASPAASEKCRNSGPSPGLLSQNLHVNSIPRGVG